jgi:hypothetical protein
MCGRVAGQLMQGIFLREWRTCPPIMVEQGARRGECRGNLLIEPEEPLTVSMAARIMARRLESGLAADSPEATKQSTSTSAQGEARASRGQRGRQQA